MKTKSLEQLKSVSTDSLEKKLVKNQDSQKSNKYKQIKRTTDKSNVDYSVTEYVCSNGSVGFDIIFYKTIDNIDYSKVTSYGPEANSRTADWAEIIKEELYG